MRSGAGKSPTPRAPRIGDACGTSRAGARGVNSRKTAGQGSRAGVAGRGEVRSGQAQRSAEQTKSGSRSRQAPARGAARKPASAGRPRAGERVRAGDPRARRGSARVHRNGAAGSLRGAVRRRVEARGAAPAVNLTVVVAVVGVIALILAVVFGVKFMTNKISSQQTVSDPAEPFTPVACAPENLSTSFSHSGTTAGQKVQFSLELTNKDQKRPCVTSAGYEDVRVLVTSGGHTVFDSQACKIGGATKRLLLDAGMSTKVPITWNGVVGGADCTGTSLSQPGTYVAQAFIGDKPISAEGQSFALVAPGQEAASEPDQQKPVDQQKPADQNPAESQAPEEKPAQQASQGTGN